MAPAASTASRRLPRRERARRALGSPLLVLIAALLAAAGAAAVYAATFVGLISTGSTPYRYLARDLVNLAVAVALGVAVSWIGYERVARLSWVVYGTILVALGLVLTPLGTQVNGASAWFALGPVQLEPSQIAVLALIILLARMLASTTGRTEPLGLRRVLAPLVLAGLVVLLVLAEPALGMALVMVAVIAAMLALVGLTRRTMAILVVAMVIAVVAAAQMHVVKPYQQQRLSSFLHPNAATSTGYQTLESEIAVGSGGVSGQGLLSGAQTNGSFVPEQRTDFIFTVVAEETGFVGSAALLTLLGALCLTALRIASRARDEVGRLMAGAIALWFSAQAFVNVGMTLGILPVTGIPLPFLSYGGSGLFVDVGAVGLLCSIARERPGSPAA